MNRTAVLNIVGLTPNLLGEHTPNLSALAREGTLATVGQVLPAVTCSVQATYLTGRWPADHGVVGNGWYFREEGEVKLWRQSNLLVQSQKIWETARERFPGFTCANLFWWFNMNSSVDYAVTPRPMYPADGRKIPDVYTQPSELRDELQSDLGQFPLFSFWGPNANITSTAWIARAAMHVETHHTPALSLVYLPHLDYPLQQHGPDLDAVAGDLRAVDDLAGDLIRFYEARGVQVVVLSEYGIEHARQPVHVNRVLREAGLLRVRNELGRDVIDPMGSQAFAVADHQVAHVYVNDRSQLHRVRALLEVIPGVQQVLDESGKQERHLNHDRAGDFVLVAQPGAWFTYYYWLDDTRAPDYAHTVDIHRKPGYDPAELFMNPRLRFPKLRAARRLLQKKLGFRSLMDVIGIDAGVVKGTHGRVTHDPSSGPLLITRRSELVGSPHLQATEVHDVLLAHLGSQAV